jgi:predicted transcriptional regulator
MSMSLLSRLVGVSRPCIYLWEQGERHPRSRYQRRLEAVLGLDPGSLKREGAVR